MGEDGDNQQSATHEIEREIREQRKFSPTEALARMAGPGALKGASPVSRLQRAEIEIGIWSRAHLADSSGALSSVLQRHLNGSELLLKNLDEPLVALIDFCEHVLESEDRLGELVRQADVEWGQNADERPSFEKEGFPAQPEDPYTLESVRRTLSDLLRQLANIEK
jgi:hypothetical protein